MVFPSLPPFLPFILHALTVLLQCVKHCIKTGGKQVKDICPHSYGTFRREDLSWGGTSFVHSFIDFKFIENLLWARHGASPWDVMGCNSCPQGIESFLGTKGTKVGNEAWLKQRIRVSRIQN